MPRKPELGKWLLWRHFYKNEKIRPYLPQTALFTPAKLKEFLKLHNVVYVKPQAGSRGAGIMKVWKKGGKVAVKHTVKSAQVFESFSDALRYVNRLRGSRGYVVQRGISLARVDGRAFDVRVMVQKSRPGGKWLYSGMLAKVAGPGSVVTNVGLSRGRVLSFEDAVQESLGWNEEGVKKLKSDLIRLSLLGASHFDSYQPYREIGFDWAVDSKGRLWLLEENTGPSHGLFRKLKSHPELYKGIRERWNTYQSFLSGGKHK